MFRDLFQYAPNWTKIVWDMIKADSKDNHHEFGEFITRQLTNRITEYAFDEETISSEMKIDLDELSAVVEGERYIQYPISSPPNVAFTGDLFLEGDCYYLNIRAQCDLARDKNPKLYLIKGKELDSKDIVMENIKLTSEEYLHVGDKRTYTLDSLKQIAQDDTKLIELNALLQRHRDEAFFASGNIIGKKSEVYIACVAGKKALKFRLDIAKIETFNKMKDKRIGRILPPYITSIQQSCASYITREGTMPTPKEVFSLG
jgi:hypothetical protein